MDVIYLVLCLMVFAVSLAVFANRFRRTYQMDFHLKPNCLLTRWPIIFITGPRSLFYFSHYWNLYTVFLAEHGYEVFTVHLPWHNPAQRRQRFELFLKQQAETHKNFHAFLDSPTLKEFEETLKQVPSLVSITEIANSENSAGERRADALRPRFRIAYETLEFSDKPSPGLLLKLSYNLHKWTVGRKNLLCLNALGALPQSALNNSLRLLERAQFLAEMDLRHEDSLK